MNNDLISREALKKAICPYDNTDYCQDIETILKIIDNAPTFNFDRPTLIIYDQVLFLNQGHIDALAEYDKEQSKKEAIKHLFSSLDSFKGEE